MTKPLNPMTPAANSQNPNIALVHHWAVSMRGGEKVLEQFAKLFPEAVIRVLVSNPALLSPVLQARSIKNSFLQWLPKGNRLYKKLLFLFPFAVRHLEVPRRIDFVLSSDASVVKGVRIPPGVPHLCYCHSPPRYLWDLYETYMKETAGLGRMGRIVFRATAPWLRRFDYEAAQKVTHFVANSKFVQERIRLFYGRESTVVYPPVALDEFEVSTESDDFYLIVSELTPYKRVDIAVKALNKLGRKLVIIGRGSEEQSLRSLAGPTVELLGPQPYPVLKQHFARCRALLFCGIEDFGITPLEAQASGKPVIGYARGGLLETTVADKTAVWFEEQTPESLMKAVEKFEANPGKFDPWVCRAQAELFSEERFRAGMQRVLLQLYPAVFSGLGWPLAPESETVPVSQ